MWRKKIRITVEIDDYELLRMKKVTTPNHFDVIADEKKFTKQAIQHCLDRFFNLKHFDHLHFRETTKTYNVT